MTSIRITVFVSPALLGVEFDERVENRVRCMHQHQRKKKKNLRPTPPCLAMISYPWGPRSVHLTKVDRSPDSRLRLVMRAIRLIDLRCFHNFTNAHSSINSYFKEMVQSPLSRSMPKTIWILPFSSASHRRAGRATKVHLPKWEINLIQLLSDTAGKPCSPYEAAQPERWDHVVITRMCG